MLIQWSLQCITTNILYKIINYWLYGGFDKSNWIDIKTIGVNYELRYHNCRITLTSTVKTSTLITRSIVYIHFWSTSLLKFLRLLQRRFSERKVDGSSFFYWILWLFVNFNIAFQYLIQKMWNKITVGEGMQDI